MGRNRGAKQRVLLVPLAMAADVGLAEIAVAPPGKQQPVEVVSVYGVSTLGVGELAEQSPLGIQRFDSADLGGQSGYSVAQFLDRSAAGMVVNEAQGNPLQPDIRFRGYSASPLLGASQGVVVYYNGVRVNEVFGDAVNWDLLPDSSMDSLALVSGPNPVFGQNALGGAIVIQGKTGFSADGGSISLGGGSDGARSSVVEQGSNNGRWGAYVALDHYEEEGWRDFSPTDASNAYLALSYRADNTEGDLFVQAGDTDLKGNGASPEGLLEQDRAAVFTHPDQTENRMNMVNLVLRRWLDDGLRLSANVFYRQVIADSFNGDGADLEACETPDEAFLCEEEDEGGEQVEDQFGQPVSSEFNAINNISRRDQRSWGGALHLFWQTRWLGLDHQLDLGGDVLFGQADFTSRVEFARLTPQRSTTRSGLFNAEGGNDLRTDNDLLGLYLSDTIQLGPDVNVQASVRYNRVAVSGRDRSGERPELTASHRYIRWNGGLGANVALHAQLTFYAGLYQSSRAPTPIELACSHPDAPCTLPNTFLADPPLKDVVSRSVEAGLRGDNGAGLSWQAGVFNTENRDDIHFQTTAGVSSNKGYFINVGKTAHRGLETRVDYQAGRLDVNLSYSYLEAIYLDPFISFSPHHPQADNNALVVTRNSHLPGIPRHNAKAALDYRWSDTFSTRVEANATSGVYLRGDEANRDRPTDSFMVFNLGLEYRPNATCLVRLEVRNLLDRDYQRFGLYGDADEVLDNLDNDSPRFLSPAPPRQIMATVSYRWP